MRLRWRTLLLCRPMRWSLRLICGRAGLSRSVVTVSRYWRPARRELHSGRIDLLECRADRGAAICAGREAIPVVTGDGNQNTKPPLRGPRQVRKILSAQSGIDNQPLTY